MAKDKKVEQITDMEVQIMLFILMIRKLSQ